MKRFQEHMLEQIVTLIEAHDFVALVDTQYGNAGVLLVCRRPTSYEGPRIPVTIKYKFDAMHGFDLILYVYGAALASMSMTMDRMTNDKRSALEIDTFLTNLDIALSSAKEKLS